MHQPTPASRFKYILNHTKPSAAAWIQGNTEYPQLSGTVKFYPTSYGGVLVEAEIFGLSNSETSNPETSKYGGFYAMHIHEYGNCTQPFDQTGSHYNPHNMPHPQHAGDMPSLLSNHGYAYQLFYDQRFLVDEIIGKSVVIHAMTDDFKSQPSGASGEKIGCGVIQSVTD